MNYKIFYILFIVCGMNVQAQTVKSLNSGIDVSLRGLSVVNNKVIWVSGSNGTVGRSVDSGNTWKWLVVKGFEKNDFRDIEAFDAKNAVIMSVGEPAFILRTADSGNTWKVVYQNKTKGIFLDGMEFWNEQSGIVIGDPIDNKFFIARSFDGGLHWQDIPEKNYPVADSGEACFAASGTNIRKLNKAEACFVSGGSKSRLFIRDQRMIIPFEQGKESSGANSIAVKNEKMLIVVGGNYLLKDTDSNNCFITTDEGRTWTKPVVSPHGYRSCVEFIKDKKWICCGPNGIDQAIDDGNNWTLISKESFNVCRKAKDGKAVFFAGNNGNIAKLIF